MGPYEKNHNLVILVPQLVIHATAGMMSWGHGNPVQHAGDSRLPRPVILVPPSRYFRDSGNDELGDTGIQYNMPAIADSLGLSFSRKRESSTTCSAIADSLFSLLDSRYDEKYGR